MSKYTTELRDVCERLYTTQRALPVVPNHGMLTFDENQQRVITNFFAESPFYFTAYPVVGLPKIYYSVRQSTAMEIGQPLVIFTDTFGTVVSSVKVVSAEVKSNVITGTSEVPIGAVMIYLQTSTLNSEDFYLRCDSYNNKPLGYEDVDTVVAQVAPKIFNFNFPIFDENYRLPLEKKILKHYYTRELCEETYGLWKLRLNSRMNEIMPYYNKLYESELIKYNPLEDTDYTQSITREVHSEGSEDVAESMTDNTSNEHTQDKTIGEASTSNTNTDRTNKFTENVSDIGTNSSTETGNNTESGTSNLEEIGNNTQNTTNKYGSGGIVKSTEYNNITDQEFANANEREEYSHEQSVDSNGYNETGGSDGLNKTGTVTTGYAGTEEEVHSYPSTGMNEVHSIGKRTVTSDTPQSNIGSATSPSDAYASQVVWENGDIDSISKTGSESTSKTYSPLGQTARVDTVTNNTLDTTSYGKNESSINSESTLSSDITDNTSESSKTNVKSGNMTETTTGNGVITDTTEDRATSKYGATSNVKDTTLNKTGTTSNTKDRQTLEEANTNRTNSSNTDTSSTTQDNSNTLKNREQTSDKSTVNDRTEDYLHRIYGKRGKETYQEMIRQLRENFLNIDMLIINDLADLFINLW